MLSEGELECNPACQMKRVYLLPRLLSLSHHASSFLSFTFNGVMFMFYSSEAKSVKIVNGAHKLRPGRVNSCVQSFEAVEKTGSLQPFPTVITVCSVGFVPIREA